MAIDELILTNDTMVDDTIDVPLDEGEEPREKPFEYDDQQGNLVAQFEAHPFGREELKRIANQVKSDFDEAWESTEEHRKRIAEDMRLFTGDLSPKSWPFENCANAHVPIMMENLTRLIYRVYAEVFGDWSDVFAVQANGPDDDELADLLTRHGNWQIREQITDFPRQMHRALMQYFIPGDLIVHSYWDPETELNRHEVLTADEFVIPYALTSTMSNLSDVPYRVKVLHRYRHQLQAMRGAWEGVERVIDREPPGWLESPDAVIAERVAEDTKIDVPERSRNAPHKLLQYEGWLELPNQDRDRFCRVILDYETLNILELSIHEHANWQDQRRYDAQLQELQDYRAAMTAYNEMLAMRELQLDQAAQTAAVAMESGATGPAQDMAIIQQIETAEQVPPPEPPMAPEWMRDPADPDEMPEPVKMEPIHLFTHAVCVEPMRGSVGMGFGRIQADFNRAANTSLNQFVDQATLSNVRSLLVDTLFKVQGGKLDLRPGAINYVEGIPAGALKDHLHEFSPGPANPQLKELVEMMFNFGQSSIQSPSVLSGEPGKSGETARGIAARIEQATKQLSVTGRKFLNEALEPVLKNNAVLNSIYLKDEELFFVNDHRLSAQAQAPGMPPMLSSAAQELRIGRQMYERNYRVSIRADLRFTSMAQRIAEADEMLSMPKLVPQLMANVAFIHKALSNALKARGQEDLIPLLGPPPPPPTTPLGVPQQPQGMPGQPAPGAPGPMPPGGMQ